MPLTLGLAPRVAVMQTLWYRSRVAGAIAVGVTAVFLPIAAFALAAGLVTAGAVVPAVAAAVCRGKEREATARGELSAEVVEIVSGSPELVAFGVERDRLDRLRVTDLKLGRLARRAALADGAGDGIRLLVTGVTVAGVLASPSQRTRTTDSTAC